MLLYIVLASLSGEVGVLVVADSGSDYRHNWLGSGWLIAAGYVENRGQPVAGQTGPVNLRSTEGDVKWLTYLGGSAKLILSVTV